MLVDSHCHLDYFTDAELPDVLARAEAAGVHEMVTIGTTIEQAAKVLKLVETHPNVWGTVGVHPHHAAEAEIPHP
ncbi:MAG TPA: TatD family hydrolase, partial [Acetobacteraceae bacterium]|nr:TatD family hydrolase [Acetobacteraceae bacterium]